MKNLTNIEKLATKRTYTGYADGVWRITKEGLPAKWVARHVDGTHRALYARTLQTMSAELQAVASRVANCAAAR